MEKNYITKQILISLLCLFCFNLIGYGQTSVYLGYVTWIDNQNYPYYGYNVPLLTPNGSNLYAEYITQDAWTSNMKNAVNNYYIQTYPNATFLSDATANYNCHNYAWRMTEGFSTPYRLQDPYPYWNDGSYVETTSQYAEKIYYYNIPNDSHSAVPSSVSGMYESKFGFGPLMRHAPGYGPYHDAYTNYMNYRRYYAKPPQISGHNIVTNTVSSTFTLAFSPLNYTINWVFDSSLFSAVGSTTGSSVTIKAKSSSVVGVGTLTAQFKKNGQVVATSTYAIYANRLPTQSTPSLRVVRSSDGVQAYPGSVGLCPNTYYYGYLTGTNSNYNYTWDMNHATVYSSSYNQAYFQTDSQGWTFLDLYATDPTTGVTQQVYSVTLYDGYSCN